MKSQKDYKEMNEKTDQEMQSALIQRFGLSTFVKIMNNAQIEFALYLKDNYGLKQEEIKYIDHAFTPSHTMRMLCIPNKYQTYFSPWFRDFYWPNNRRKYE
jgi:hypothetical protein